MIIQMTNLRLSTLICSDLNYAIIQLEGFDKVWFSLSEPPPLRGARDGLLLHETSWRRPERIRGETTDHGTPPR